MNAWAYLADTDQQGWLMFPLEPQTAPRTGKTPSSGSSAVPALSFGNSQLVGTRFGHSKPNHTQVEYMQKPSKGSQTWLTTKNLNKCSNDKLCFITAPPIGRQRAERNRTKVYAWIKHSMLMFKSIIVNKNDDSYNSTEQKN